MSSALCAALVGCAGTGQPATQTVVRTPAPQEYEKTITNYLAFRIRGSQKNAEISFTPPEPGACPLDGYGASVRGWVVPVVYATRRGEATGRETINITTKQYYFWFRGETIAGITQRIELCPGLGSIFSDAAPPRAAASELLPAALAAPTQADARGREKAPDRVEPTKRGRTSERAKAAGGRKHATAAKKITAAPGKPTRAAKAADDSRDPGKPTLRW